VLRFVDARLLDGDQRQLAAFTCGAESVFDLRLRNTTGAGLRNVHVSVGIENAFGQRVVTWSTSYAGGDLASVPPGDSHLRIRLPRLALMPGSYRYYLFASAGGDVADWLLPGGTLEVEPGDFYGSGQLPGPRDGTFVADHTIEFEAC
jgi:lipopolysaccharide transport system ATP-binding protein